MFIPGPSLVMVVLLIVAYWATVVGGWTFYTSRPARQARARERHLKTVVEDPATGNLTMEYGVSINFLTVALILLGPPLLLVGWALARA